jgi:hypothetical protein
VQSCVSFSKVETPAVFQSPLQWSAVAEIRSVVAPVRQTVGLSFSDGLPPDEVHSEEAESIAVTPPRSLSAMEFLALNQNAVRPTSPAPSDKRHSWLARLRRWLGV